MAAPVLSQEMQGMPVHDHATMMAAQAAAGNAPQAGGSFFSRLLESYIPRQVCMNYESDVIWLNVISDAVIALSYYTIPIALVYFIRKRRDVAFHWIFVAFAVFILACGTTHVFSVVAIWHTFYRLDGLVKALTALVSLATGIYIWVLMPQALAIPSPALLRIANQELRGMKEQLEQRVQERTRELESANAALREQVNVRIRTEIARARLAAIVECSNDAIIGKTLDGIITDWNAAAESLFGYTADEIIGKSVLTIIPTERHAEEPTILERLRRGERIEHFETIRVRKDGRRLHISLTASPIKDQEGHVVGVSKIARDISDRKLAEERMDQLLSSERAARTEAENASRLKDEFVATLSHELRTPLNAVLGWAQILRSPSSGEKDIGEGLEIIERNARSQVQLIDDLLDMSRIMSGKLRLNVKRVNLAEVIRDAIETVGPAAAAKGIRIEIVVDPLAEPIMGDPNRLQQVVWNLLSNAVKFNSRDGRVQVQLRQVQSHVEILVSDTGAGITPDFLPFVFDRFRQADSSTTRQHGGLGLGLSIVKHLVELHGGIVWCRSPGEGGGSIFCVSLPEAGLDESSVRSDEGSAVSASTASREATPDANSLKGLKILVVDDEPDARTLLKRLLQEFGATVTVVPSARDAYDVIRAERPDVIISDIGMPDEDGYAFINKVRSWPAEEGGATPAIALTAFAQAEDRRRAITNGFQRHIAKPVDPEELVAAVASVVHVK